MNSPTFLFFLSLLSIHLLALTNVTVAQPKMLYNDCVKDKGNYTTNSTYQTNLNHLLASIYNNTQISYGFYNSSYGEDPDKVFGIALCRPDIKADDCRACIKNASDALLSTCPNYKEAIGGYDNCMLRYSNRFIFGSMEAGPYFFVNGLTNVSDVTGFNQSRISLLDELSDKASSGDSRYKYAAGNKSAPNSQTIYALVQCTPDLSKQQCSSCLAQATKLIPQCCDEREGGRVITPSCNFRYEIGPFYVNIDPKVEVTTPVVPTSSPTSPPPSSTSARIGDTRNIIVGALIIIGSFSMLLL